MAMEKLKTKVRTKNITSISAIDKKINNLTPGDSVVLSKVDNNKVVAERSGDGKKLTIFRESSNGFEVIRRTSF